MKEKQFLNYLEQKGLAKATQKYYVNNVKSFLNQYGKEEIQCTKKDILDYLGYLKSNRNVENTTRRNQVISLNHYFDFLVKNDLIATNPTALIKIRGTKKKKLYHIYTCEESDLIYDNYYHIYIRNFDESKIPKNQQNQSFLCRQRNFVMLGLFIYQGLTSYELERINIDDIDIMKGTIKIHGSKRGMERVLTLKAPQIGSIINYTQNIRPQFFNYTAESNKMFLPLPASGSHKTENQSIKETIKPLAKQVRALDKNFLNFRQIRSSVITNWLKAVGLRKAQYLAGHRHINATEEYLPNNLEDLAGDISKHHPFSL